MNYVRNSVKATVDAYDGTIHFYVVDESDPMVRAYRKAFPNLFDDADQMPAGLKDHWRYPEDLFRAQTEQYATYHMTDVSDFYQKADLWDIAPEPSAEAATTTAVGTSTTAAGNDGGRNSTLQGTTDPIDPIYQMMQLPDEDGQEFVLTRSFVPRNKTNQLTAFIAARNDPAHYGEIIVYDAPANSTVQAPARAASLIESVPQISSELTLLDQRGSHVLRGKMQLIPFKDSMIYMRPIWILGRGSSSFPRFRYVAMTYADKAILAFNVEDGIKALFSPNAPAVPEGSVGSGDQNSGNENPDTTTSTTSTTVPEPSGNETVESLLDKAADELAAAERVQGTDLGAYQEHVDLARQYLQQAQQLREQQGGSTPSTTATTSG
jgi:uncharacterized membrane protein (UPF0182 family)